ncbi:MAG: putative sulfate exporter family transporter [Thermoanaerobaculia bacterium]
MERAPDSHTATSAAGARARGALFVLAALLSLSPWGSPAAALALGALLALLVTNPFASAGQKASKPLLQTCVVLLGFGMELTIVLRAGATGILFAAATILATLVLGTLLGRALSVARRTSLLISAGTAICGGSAIAAVGSVVGAGQGEMTVAIGTVFILNAVGLYVFPMLGHFFHLSEVQFGTWAGVAIHDISSVVGASSLYGPLALQTATAVKLSRALWIVPIALGASFAFRDLKTGETQPRGKGQVPWFIGLFLLASLSRSFVPAIASLSPVLSQVARLGFTLTLFLIGAGLSRETLKAVGWRPLAQGVMLWIFISVVSLLVIVNSPW